MKIERANMHCLGFASTRSFFTGLISAKVQKLECFKLAEIVIAFKN